MEVIDRLIYSGLSLDETQELLARLLAEYQLLKEDYYKTN